MLGRPGFAQVEIDAHGRTLRTISRNSATPGNTLNLTIDADLQRIAREALGSQRGAVVAIAPSSGEVLTMASSPSFDPNLFVDGIDQQTYDALRGLEDRPLLNRVLYGRYAPGSTIKQSECSSGARPAEPRMVAQDVKAGPNHSTRAGVASSSQSLAMVRFSLPATNELGRFACQLA